MTARPNILLIVFDSLSAHDMATHSLPTLHGLIAQSHRFTNAYTCCPEGSPARASLFTGLDIAAHGLWTDGVALPPRETPLPEVFAAQGYQSWLVGRRHLAGVSHWTTEHARPREYHAFDWAHGPLHRSRQNAYLAWLKNTAPDTYAATFPAQPNPDDTDIPQLHRMAMAAIPDDLGFNTWVGQRASARISEAPFCGVVGFVVGDSMGAKPDGITERVDTRALAQADAALCTILKSVPQNTIVAVTAARGSSACATPMSETALKVPLAIRVPKEPPKTQDGIVSTTDIAPTLYELAGVQPPQRIQGQSLMSAAPRAWALARLRTPDRARQSALIHDHWKLIVTHDADDMQLYDLKSDPATQSNLATDIDHQDRVETMLDLMIDARVALEDRTEPRIAKF